MRLIFAAVFLCCLVGAAVCQTPSVSTGQQLQQVGIKGFETHKRADNYGIASFTISNETDAPLNSIELYCWLDNDRAHGTKVLVWPSPQPVSPHDSRQFSNVNIGLVRSTSRPECEVAGVE
jgi:hypothetical protein